MIDLENGSVMETTWRTSVWRSIWQKERPWVRVGRDGGRLFQNSLCQNLPQRDKRVLDPDGPVGLNFARAPVLGLPSLVKCLFLYRQQPCLLLARQQGATGMLSGLAKAFTFLFLILKLQTCFVSFSRPPYFKLPQRSCLKYISFLRSQLGSRNASDGVIWRVISFQGYPCCYKGLHVSIVKHGQICISIQWKRSSCYVRIQMTGFSSLTKNCEIND